MDCSPRFDDSLDEADLFHLNKIEFTEKLFKKEFLPSHLVIYEDFEFEKFLKQFYKISKKIFHSHLAKRMDSRISNYFIILDRLK